MTKYSTKKSVCLMFSISIFALSACATQGSSRYGDIQSGPPPVPCGTVMVPCGQVIEYHPVLVTPPPYLVPAPCPAGQCAPPPQPPVAEPPVVTPPPVTVEPPYVPPVIPEPPITLPPTIVDDPLITCPEGSIPGYGGQDCIPITVPRK